MDISEEKDIPFNIKYPEYNLIPRSSFRRLNFFKFGLPNWPDYIEDPHKTSEKEYLWIVRKSIFGLYQFGILYWHESKFLGVFPCYRYHVVIGCLYERIEKATSNDNVLFLCFNKGKIQHFRDSKGRIMK